ncbi:dihydroneopterin aldolase [Frigidibacter sp. ROC022]|uniref:dihydroneopterin aldolase n=1 Tax=Frigidibacter sp. ROC022 TaxID=2971796 RepID=UPI00215AA4D1|nr:dihydroneopterin aldolase [Frigidibacter sp. ROC022]MCR8725256.1 dihydroneopterin aldolase [Frigidibacter sp. ROC022]
MPSETAQAFGPPEMRAEATASGPADRISLRDHVVEAEIGAFQEERGRRQRLAFNVVVEVVPLAPPFDDDVDRILSYDTITEAIAAELGAERINLLETLAGRIAERILARPQALRVFVRVEKLDRGPGALGVEIVRGREHLPGRPEPVGPTPRVVFLAPEAVASPLLTGWLDQLEASGPASVLCVGAEGNRPQAIEALAQRRIDLLAIEQAAWVLAARDRRCVVVGSRTEMDHAVKHHQIVVWAPSKLVLDTPRGVEADPRDPVGLALWLAQELGAVDVLLIGAEAPPEVPGLTLRSRPATEATLD